MRLFDISRRELSLVSPTKAQLLVMAGRRPGHFLQAADARVEPAHDAIGMLKLDSGFRRNDDE
jgi:hypothetical protein